MSGCSVHSISAYTLLPCAVSSAKSWSTSLPVYVCPTLRHTLSKSPAPGADTKARGWGGVQHPIYNNARGSRGVPGPNAGCSGLYDTAWSPACSLADEAAFDHGHIKSLDLSRWIQSYTGGLPPRDRDKTSVSTVPRLATTSEHKKSQVHRSPLITARYPRQRKQDLGH